MRVRRSVFAVSVPLLIAIGVVTAIPQAAAATAPVNDLLVNAKIISSIPFSETFDVSGATADADDFAALSPCFPGVTFPISNSVWYSYTAATDINLGIDLSGTFFGPGVVIAENQEGNFGWRECTVSTSIGSHQIRTQIGAGVEVSILIFSTRPLTVAQDLAVAFYAVTVPANDTIDRATAISALPFTEVIDLSRATTDDDDVQVNETCGMDLQHTVWYTFTAGPEDTSLLVSTNAEHYYYARVIIASGSPGALTLLNCSYGAVAAETIPGTTYYVLIDSNDRLPVTISRAPPKPTFTMSFDGQGTLDRPYGTVRLTGTYSCSDVEFGSLSGFLQQTRGSRVVRQGGFGLQAVCDGTPHAFSETVWDYHRQVPPGTVLDPFVPGKAVATGFANICSVWGCDVLSSHPSEVQLVR